jgi:hypothetical protein
MINGYFIHCGCISHVAYHFRLMPEGFFECMLIAVIDGIMVAIIFVTDSYYERVGRLYFSLMCKGNKA